MPHTSNGKIYIDKTVTPHKGIDVRGDIAVVLGRDTGDIGQLYWDKDKYGSTIAHPAVNMWSRKKPVPWSINNTRNLHPQEAHQNDWWKGIDGNFGIVAKSADTTNVLSFIDGEMNGWTYSRDALAPRVYDFEDYYQNAPNPFDSLFLQADRDAVAPGGTLTFQYQLRAGGGATADSLGIVELASGLQVGGVQKSISDLYAAFIIYKKQSGGGYTYYDWCSASETLSDLESDPAMHSVAYTVPNAIGEYKYVPVMTTVKKEQSAQAISSFITIPGTDAASFVIAENVNPYMQVDAFVVNSGTSANPNYNNTIYFYVEFFGGSNGSSFDNISLAFQTSQGVAYKTLTNVQNQGVSGALTVPANSFVKKPAGSGNVYSTPWTSQFVTLENLVRNLGGEARIYPQSGSTLASYKVPIREAAGMPGGTVTPF